MSKHTWDLHFPVKALFSLIAVVGLINSEFPTLQKLALEASSQAFLDKKLREMAEEIKILPTLLGILSNPDSTELHLSALSATTNLLEDVEIVQQMSSAGHIQRLLTIVTGTSEGSPVQISPQEDLQKSAKKQQTSRPKKGKTTERDASGKKEEKQLPTLTPEAKVLACQILMKAAKKEDIRQILHDAGAEQSLLSLLTNEDAEVRAAAANVVGVFSEHSLAQQTIAKLGGVEILTRLLRSENIRIRSAGVFALSKLTTRNPGSCKDFLGVSNAVETLVSFLSHTGTWNEAMLLNTLTTISNLSNETVGRKKLLAASLIKGLIVVFTSRYHRIQAKSASLLASLLLDESARQEFIMLGGLPALVSLLSSAYPEARRAACLAIRSVVRDTETATVLYDLGALDELYLLNQNGVLKSYFCEMAIQQILDCHSILKFALTGRLGFLDTMGDLFYDVGPLRAAEKLKTLQFYADEPLDHRRPVYLLNSRKAPEPVSIVQEAAIASTEDTLMDKKKPTKSQKKPVSRKTPQAHEANPSIQVGSSPSAALEAEKVPSPDKDVKDKPVPPVNDPNLQAWVKTVKEKIRPTFPISRQAETLASLVANLLGGPFPKDKALDCDATRKVADYRCQRNTNIVPIGVIDVGNYLHRALLFKFLAGVISLPCSLVRGEYGISYNTVRVTGSQEEQYEVVVDLMNHPGRLISVSSQEAMEYLRL
ncbi:Armadillo repeat-containing protein 3 [Sparganum proliferum]